MNILTEEEKRLAKLLGLDKFIEKEQEKQAKVEKRLARKRLKAKLSNSKSFSSSRLNPSKDPYNLIRIHTCKTCGTVYNLFFRMQWNQELGMLTPQPCVNLESFQSDQDRATTKIAKSNIETCDQCEVVLNSLPHEALVALLLKNRRREIWVGEEVKKLCQKVWNGEKVTENDLKLSGLS